MGRGPVGLARLRAWARRLAEEVGALYLAAGDARVPWYARVLALALVAYALSPLDLIPDPIPVIGLLDDLLLVPLGIALFVRLVPEQVWAECRERAAGEDGIESRRLAAVGAGLVGLVWVAVAIAVWRAFAGGHGGGA